MTALDFALPAQLEAREPAEERGSGRDDVRMLVSELATGRVTDTHFRALPQFLRRGDLVVLNTSATLPAALRAWRADGSEIALHWSSPLPPVRPASGGRRAAGGGGEMDGASDEPLAEVSDATNHGHTRVASQSEEHALPLAARRVPLAQPAVVELRAKGGQTRLSILRGDAPIHENEVLTLAGGGGVTILSPYRDSQRLWIARLELDLPVVDYLRRWGRPIRYSYIERPFPISAYQTVYARSEGSAEMPSAGRAFTRSMLACLRHSGVGLAKLVLHTGVASLESHEKPYEEWYEVPAATAEKVRRAKTAGGRVIAVGTTVVRALESSVDKRGQVIASSGWTDLVITPERGVRVVTGLLTGLHEPKATHLDMLQSIAGRETLERAYEVALEREYLWHEFGDLHLIA
jgi:S-adenosylmethionine:tRNA ribosyltransferase-isomerase